jgi:hypothetical protein
LHVAFETPAEHDTNVISVKSEDPAIRASDRHPSAAIYYRTSRQRLHGNANPHGHIESASPCKAQGTYEQTRVDEDNTSELPPSAESLTPTHQDSWAELRDPKHRPWPPDWSERIDKLLEEDNREEPSLSKWRKVLEKTRTKVRYFKNLTLRWLKKACPTLGCPVGIPAKLQPFIIDTGSQPPIKVPPRKYSPVDQAKIKEFIDEGLESGIISEWNRLGVPPSSSQRNTTVPHAFESIIEPSTR